MKTSRTGRIILAAENRVAEILDVIPGDKARRSAEGVNVICATLVKRRTPILPTAHSVSEEGRNQSNSFPSHQTIYNNYAKILKVWRRAYYDVVNIDVEAPLSGDDVQKIDTGQMEVGTANIVDRLKVIIFELTQRNNVLKQIIDDVTPAYGGKNPPITEHEEVMVHLGRWLRNLADNPAFQLDEFALKVSRRTPPGTRIIDVELLEKLLTLTEEFEAAMKARQVAG
ncbi:hypothetical protein [Rhizobium binxianense]